MPRMDFNDKAFEQDDRHELLKLFDKARRIAHRNKQEAIAHFGTFIDDVVDDTKLSIFDKSCILMTYTGCLTDIDDFETAVEYAEIACNLDPSDIRSLTRLATIQKLMGNYQDAEDTYYKAINIDFTDKFVLTGMGGLQEEMGNMEKAAEYYGLALKYNPNDGMALKRLEQLNHSPF